jgi:hypothetical protein
VTISIGGLPDEDEDDCGVSRLSTASGTVSSSVSSTLALTSSAGAAFLVLGEGESGEEVRESALGALRRLIVTLLDGGSAGGFSVVGRCSGV